ncbi:Mu transposase C-terminal domain-containing protein [Caballeronia sp. LjRoot29]|uniref:hypothetical protein n=1 Tax=Caballeronia sp. LjRoot29 TaxID=3342315 RepID=UPI003ECC5BBF
MDAFDTAFQRYLDEIYHCNHHTGIGISPNEAWAFGMSSHGHRLHTVIPYDAGFIAQSCPQAVRGTVKVTPQGVKINYLWFKCDEFSLPGVMDSRVPARYDPFNAGLAYAFVKGCWHAIHSEHYAILSRFTERSIKLASERLHLIARLSGAALRINAERLAAFLLQTEAQELLATQAMHDAEAAEHRAKIMPSQNAEDMPLAQTPPRPRSSTPRILEDLE